MNAAADECVERNQFYDGKSHSFEACKARVDDVVKTTVDGYVMINYIVQFRAQRLVVSDPLTRTDHKVGDEISFTVGRIESPKDSPRVYRTLYAIIDFPELSGKAPVR